MKGINLSSRLHQSGVQLENCSRLGFFCFVQQVKSCKVCVSSQGGRCQSCSYLESQLHSCPVNQQVTPDQASAARKTQKSPAQSMGTY